MRFSALFRLPALAACLALGWPLSPGLAQAQTSPPGGGGPKPNPRDPRASTHTAPRGPPRRNSHQ